MLASGIMECGEDRRAVSPDEDVPTGDFLTDPMSEERLVASDLLEEAVAETSYPTDGAEIETDELDVAADEPDVATDEVSATEGSCSDDPTVCEEPALCIAGGCVEPVEDLGEYADQAASRFSSYWYLVQHPYFFSPPERCCFDFTGDDVPDDALSAAIHVFALFVEDWIHPRLTLGFAIQDGSLTLVNDWLELPEGDGACRLSVFSAIPRNPDSGMADWDPAVSSAANPVGDGQFDLDPDSFSPYGAYVQFNAASITTGTECAGRVHEGPCLDTGPDGPTIRLPLTLLGVEPRRLAIDNARIVAPLSIEVDTVRTLDEERVDGTVVGGGHFGGTVSLHSLFTYFDDWLRSCTCANVNPVLPVFEIIREPNGTVAVSCTENNGDGYAACDENDEPACSSVEGWCLHLLAFRNAVDVDTDGDGTLDALSLGLRFGWTGGSIVGLG